MLKVHKVWRLNVWMRRAGKSLSRSAGKEDSEAEQYVEQQHYKEKNFQGPDPGCTQVSPSARLLAEIFNFQKRTRQPKNWNWHSMIFGSMGIIYQDARD